MYNQQEIVSIILAFNNNIVLTILITENLEYSENRLKNKNMTIQVVNKFPWLAKLIWKRK